MSSLQCETCGSADFRNVSGLFICNNCDIVSQDVEDQRFEFVDFGRAPDNEEREEVISEKSLVERTLTSWECYNIVLKGLVEELINLGASKQINYIAFQLWASYLKWSNVAFTSKTDENLPALSLGFRKNDAKTLYGVSNLRTKLFKNNHGRQKLLGKRKYSSSENDTLSLSSRKNILSKQRNVASEEFENEGESGNEFSFFEGDTLASLDKERELRMRKKTNVVFKSSALKILNEVIDKKPEKVDFSINQIQNRKSNLKINSLISNRRLKTVGKRGYFVPVTMVTLITILRLALQLVNDEIYLGDILRWICEGRLSCNQPEKFVPLFYLFVKKSDALHVRRRGYQLDIRNFTFHLNFSDLPTPNLYNLADRYCSELCLPNEFTQIVLKLMTHSKMKMDYMNYNFRAFPDYECRVMAFILFVFKLFFILDDFTEYHLSKFADAVNKMHQSKTKSEFPKLFSWNSWMRFIECRKSTLSEYNIPVNQITYNDETYNQDTFLSYFEKVKPLHGITDRKINSALLSALSYETSNLFSAHLHKNDDVIIFPPSCTPFKSDIEYLIKNHSDKICPASLEILSENFSLNSIKYAASSTLCSNIIETFQINVELLGEVNCSDFETYNRPDYSLLATCPSLLPRSDVLLPVFIDNSLPPDINGKQTGHVPCELSIHKIESKFVENETTNLKLYHPSHYWCFHQCNNNTTNEEFELAVAVKFPRSFLWLLRECSAMLKIDAKDLYFELVLVESVLQRLHMQPKDRGFLSTRKMKEW